jgi:hypothetical protein
MEPVDPTTVATGSLAYVDETDPLVAGMTWFLTFLANKYAIPDRFKPMIPVVAILIATALVASLQATQGEALTVATLVRGFGAGAAAIAGHEGTKEISKFVSSEKAQPSPDEPEEAPAEEPEEATDPGDGEE